jgi:EmrB/QacA subfamily drug resistance transporter
MTTTDTNPDTLPQQMPRKAGAQNAPPADRKRRIALVVLLVAVFMDMLDGTVINVAIPVIQRDLGASYPAIQWMSAGYVFAFALLLITGARLGDIYGHKRIFQIGVLGFVVASLLCGIAADPQTLVAWRLLQGAMAGIMVPQVLSIIHVTFPPKQRGPVLAIYGLVGGVAATTAPLIGGLLVNANVFGLEWRPVFLVNVPIGIAGFLLGGRYIAESKAPVSLRLDLVGVAISTIGLLLLMYPLTMGRDLGWPAWTFVSVAAGIVVLVAFVWYERYRERKDGSSLVSLGLFKARSFAAGLSLQVGFFLLTGLFFLSWYLFMQLGLGWSALHAGSTALAFCVGAFLTSAASVTVLVPKFGRAVLQAGAVTMVLGFAVFYWIAGAKGSQIGTWHMVTPLFMLGLGFGAVAAPIPLFALVDVPHRDAGSASGLINTMQQLGLALGIALVGAVFLSPLSGFAAESAETVAPRLRHELVIAGVPDKDADAVVASFRACAVDRFTGDDPTATPVSCRAAASVAHNPRASAVLARFGGRASAETFASAFPIAILSSAVVILVVLLLTFGLPKKLQPQDEVTAAAVTSGA